MSRQWHWQGDQTRRLIGGGTVGLGALLIARPRQVTGAVSADGSRVTRAVLRVLGARYLAQGGAQLGWPRAAVMGGSAIVDGLHAASMLAVAWRRVDYRRPALVSATVALASAAVCALNSRPSTATRA